MNRGSALVRCRILFSSFSIKPSRFALNTLNMHPGYTVGYGSKDNNIFVFYAAVAALYGADILTGKSQPANMKVGVVSPPDIAINFLRAREIGLKIPFSFFEAATFIFDAGGRPVRIRGQTVSRQPGG